jgi:monofunctional biosynthetic peptidoglycan transglycosylase
MRVGGALLRWTIRLLGAFVVLSVIPVVVYRFVNPPLTPLMLIRRQGIIQQWMPLRDVSPLVLRAVVVAEDGRFWEHHGVDWAAVDRAREYNERQRGTRLRGGSTITMQCARNVFLWPGRTYVRKVVEIWFAYLIELAWGKPRILEVYVNVIEWGDGLYGVEAAARRYFGVSAAALDGEQAALLAASLPNPHRWNPSRPTPYLAGRAALIARRATARP